MEQVVGLMVEIHEIMDSILSGGYAFDHPSTCASWEPTDVNP
jgi:hypothetical protein